MSEPWFRAHDLWAEKTATPDTELDAAFDSALVLEAATYFTREGIHDCV